MQSHHSEPKSSTQHGTTHHTSVQVTDPSPYTSSIPKKAYPYTSDQYGQTYP